MIKMPEILVFWLTDFLTLSIQTLKVLYNYIINHINIYTNADIKKCQSLQYIKLCITRI